MPSSTDPTPPHTCETSTSSSSTLRVTSNGVLPAVPETDSINTVTSEAPCHIAVYYYYCILCYYVYALCAVSFHLTTPTLLKQAMNV